MDQDEACPSQQAHSPGVSLNRLVYKLVRVNDDGSVLPTTDQDMDDDMHVECFLQSSPPTAQAQAMCNTRGEPTNFQQVGIRNDDEQHRVQSTGGDKPAPGQVFFSFSTPNVEGKRKRKPNRRYIEDETDNLYFTSDIQRLVSDGTETYDVAKLYGESENGGGSSDFEYPGFATPVQTTVHGRRNELKRKPDRKVSKLARLAWSSRSRGSHEKEKLISSPGKESFSDLESSMFGEFTEMQPLGGEDCELDFPGEHVETVPTPNGGTRRKHHRPWTLREVMILVEGVARCGGGKWADIKKLEFSSVSYRTAVDLKDKWRNLLRASRVHFTSKQQTEHKKKHFAVSIPQPILARVRELAAMQNQQSSMPVLTRTSRSGRTLRRK